jgi:hypothetical protein
MSRLLSTGKTRKRSFSRGNSAAAYSQRIVEARGRNQCALLERKGTHYEIANKLHQELRRRILSLSDVTERQNSGIHDDAFFVGGKMFMHIHPESFRGCDIQLAKDDQERVLAEGKARQHRRVPEAGYVTVIVHREEDLEPAMDLIRMSHRYFADKRNLSRMQHQ